MLGSSGRTSLKSICRIRDPLGSLEETFASSAASQKSRIALQKYIRGWKSTRPLNPRSRTLLASVRLALQQLGKECLKKANSL